MEERSTVIELSATARYRSEGKQFVARITGRHPKFTFEREFIGRKSGRRGEDTNAKVDEPGLYQTRDIDSKGRADDTFVLIWLDAGSLRERTIDEEDAMAIAKIVGDEEEFHAAAVALEIAALERGLSHSEGKDPDGIVTLKRGVGSLGAGAVRRRDLVAARLAEIARLRGEAPALDRAALEAERKTLEARLAEINALLAG